MAFHLLEKDRDGAKSIVDALQNALAHVGECQRCRMLAESELCPICADSRRDHGLICVVESPADVLAVEDSGAYRGVYFVLMGRLSPLDGIGPDELGVAGLETWLADTDAQVREVVLATSATVEGEATAAFLGSLAAKYGAKATRIAHGVPMGGELEFVDSNTLFRAIESRTHIAGD